MFASHSWLASSRFHLALGAALLGSSVADAATIAVANASFETLPSGGLPIACGTNCSYSRDVIPGWTTTPGGDLGQAQPGPPVNTTYFNYVPDGITVAYSNGGEISQIVSPLAQAGLTYTLSVDLGFRKDTSETGNVKLVVGANTIIATGADLGYSGNWATYTASYTATAADAGKPIEIVLINTGSGQGDWDNVRLTDIGTAVPELSTWSLMLLGFATLGFARSRSLGKSNAA